MTADLDELLCTLVLLWASPGVALAGSPRCLRWARVLALRRAGWSQRQIGAALGMSAPRVQQLEWEARQVLARRYRQSAQQWLAAHDK